MHDVITTSTRTTTPNTTVADTVGDLVLSTPVTGGRGYEVGDVVDMLAELKFLQDLDRLF